jgi:transposase-like protein
METESDTRSSVGRSGGVPSKKPGPRYYPLDLKRRIVEETFGPGQSVSIVARRHDVNANLVFAWRKRYRDGTLGKGDAASKVRNAAGQDLIRIGVIDAGNGLRAPRVDGNSCTASTTPFSKTATVRQNCASGASIIEIELPNRIKLRVASSIEGADLRRVLLVSRQMP